VLSCVTSHLIAGGRVFTTPPRSYLGDEEEKGPFSLGVSEPTATPEGIRVGESGGVIIRCGEVRKLKLGLAKTLDRAMTDLGLAGCSNGTLLAFPFPSTPTPGEMKDNLFIVDHHPSLFQSPWSIEAD